MMKPCYEILNGTLGWRVLRNRGLTRTWVASQLTCGLRYRLSQFLAGTRETTLSAKKSGYLLSLTSWKPRLTDLPIVLLTLLEQHARPLGIMVWLTEEDEAILDPVVKKRFAEHGVDFRVCDNLGPHKKWLPMVEEGRTEPFVICDDDILYPTNWLHRLTAEDRRDAYVGVRCHKLRRSISGKLLAYDQWQRDVAHECVPSKHLFITGCGGAIIHPRRIGEEFKDRERIAQECPRADDIWLKAAHLASDVACYKTKFSFPCLEIPGSEATGLLQTNVNNGANDTQMGILRQIYTESSVTDRE